ncbi:kinase-like domain-containing protein [Entophlyctis helioformis]|nr:kinase-like domain-containing protein [Entophlyctis helioformis]
MDMTRSTPNVALPATPAVSQDEPGATIAGQPMQSSPLASTLAKIRKGCAAIVKRRSGSRRNRHRHQQQQQQKDTIRIASSAAQTATALTATTVSREPHQSGVSRQPNANQLAHGRNKDDVIPPNASKVPESAVLDSQSSGSIDQAANSTIGKHLELSITNSSHAKPSICPAVPAIKDMSIDQLMIMHAAGTLPLMPRGDAPTTTLADAFGHDDCALVEPISPDFEPRTRPADYAMGDEIGEGGYGQVVAVTHIATQVQFACKVIAKITDVDDETYAWRQVRDAHEMLISKCAKAPHAIRTFDVMETKAFIFIVMERVNTVSDDRPSLIECMHAFHKSGIYHHDIKDGNVLVDKDVNIRLIDFGLAVIGSPLEKLDHTVGTPMFMAPEIIFDETGHYGPGADVFSLGVVSFFLRFRYLPYRVQQHFALASSDSPFDMCDLHSPFPMDTDQLDKDFFNQVLHGNPSNRLAMDGIVEHPWVTRDGLVPFTEPRPDDKTIGELLVLLDRLGMSGGTDGTKLGIEDVVEHLTDSAKADSAVRSVFLLLKAAKDGRAAFNNAVQAERERAALAVLDATTLDGACPVSVQGGSVQQMPEHESGTCQDTPPKESARKTSAAARKPSWLRGAWRAFKRVFSCTSCSTQD